MKKLLKALAVVMRNNHVLVYLQPNSRSIGPMLPGGTVEDGEDFVATAIRELHEETGLSDLPPLGHSVKQVFDMRPYKEELHERVFVYFRCPLELEAWHHWEMHPGLNKSPELLHLQWKEVVQDTELDLCHGIALLSDRSTTSFIPGYDRNWSSILTLSAEGLAFRTHEAAESLSLVRILIEDPPHFDHVQPTILNAATRMLLYGCRIAAERHSEAVLARARNWSRGFTGRSETGPVVQGISDAAVIADPRYGDDVPLFGTMIATRGALAAAFEILGKCGFSHFIDNHVGIIQFRGEVKDLEEHRSFTISATPNTIYVDNTPSALQLAEAILHEAAHNFLNDVLSARGVEIDDRTTYFSPWRGVQRPASGFLHAVFVFSIVLQMLKTYEILTGSRDEGRTDRIRLEQVRLEYSIHDVVALVRNIGIDWLEHLVYDNLNRAIQASEGRYGQSHHGYSKVRAIP